MSFEFDSGPDARASTPTAVNPSWYLAYTRPRLETVALQNLQRQGFEVYFPLYKCLKKTNAGMQAIFEPMFARYVFFRTSRQAPSVAPVRSTCGVAQLVRFGYEMATICHDTLEVIRQLEQERNAADMAQLSSLRTGQKVRFCNPALSGLQGLVKSVSSRRVTVLLEFMGREQLLAVDRQQLEVD
ncbi:MAG: transcriptional activator RfaH [Polaromonas sp.]